MKKLLLCLSLVTVVIMLLTSCSGMFVQLDQIGDTDSSDNTDDDISSDGTEDDPDSPPSDNKYSYDRFTSDELALIAEYFDFDLPFIPTNEYFIEEYAYDDEVGLNYYTFGNTEADFNGYLDIIDSLDHFDFYGTDVDEYGDKWYFYDIGDACLDISYYEYEGDRVIDVYIYFYLSDGDDTTTPPVDDTGYLYTEFSSAELAALNEFAGFVIPFIPTDEYYFDEYSDSSEYGFNYYTYGNTREEFNAYRAALSGFVFSGTDVDEYGDTWYFYDRGNYYLDLSFYYIDDGVTVIDIYLYTTGSSGDDDSGADDTANIFTNAGAGLPDGDGGVYEIVFTDALYVKDATELDYYLDGCPTTGSPAVLVIPVDFSDRTAESLDYSTAVLRKALAGGDGDADYYTLHDYYYTSSYGKLDLDITVLDFWFRPRYSSSYYESKTTDYYGEQIFIGDQMIMDEALAYLEPLMDLSRFDSDGNGIIDAVILVNTLEIDHNADFQWAYRYWNVYVDSDDYYYEYDNVSANDYIWMSYQFLYETYDEYGSVSFDDKDAINTYTFIHEFGHILGADDYYDTAGVGNPMGGYDIMDSMSGDHNPFTKFNYGWITRSRLITADSTVTLSLEDFSKNGDTIIIAANWDQKLGAYQEYFVLMYYRSTGLNSGVGGYFDRDGILVYHVNASLVKEEYDGNVGYNIYNNNTDISDELGYGTKDNLIEFVISEDGWYTYTVGDSSVRLMDSNGEAVEYTFRVDSLTSTTATLTFIKSV